jgi:acyl-coenzyme A thioesterase PaaI-like protein
MADLKAREGHDAQVRREGVERLAAAVRDLADAVAVTGVDRAALDEVTGALELLTHRLRAATDDDAYSGLVIKPVDYSIPEGPMPLNPILGACSPVRPDAQLRYRGGEIGGTASFTRRFVGPPGYAHGGISAMLADQIVAASPMAIGRRAITKSLELHYLRPLPLDEEVELWGVCEPTGDATFRARFTITARGKLAVEGSAELVSYESFFERGRTASATGVDTGE